jgi:hypothetical protein
MNIPSRSLVACCRLDGANISSLAISDDALWAGSVWSKQVLYRISRREMLSTPRSQWFPLQISPEDRLRLIAGTSRRDQTMHAFYAGDDARVIKLLSGMDPQKATIEEMLLLAWCYDVNGVDQPANARQWCERIISRYPDSPWSIIASNAIVANTQDHAVKVREQKLLARYDRNHDGVLDAAEKKLMESGPEFQREDKDFRDNQLDPQLQVLLKHYDRDGDGKLDRKELEYIKSQVAVFVEAPPESLPGTK